MVHNREAQRAQIPAVTKSQAPIKSTPTSANVKLPSVEMKNSKVVKGISGVDSQLSKVFVDNRPKAGSMDRALFEIDKVIQTPQTNNAHAKMRKSEQKKERVCEFWKKHGVCQFGDKCFFKSTHVASETKSESPVVVEKVNTASTTKTSTESVCEVKTIGPRPPRGSHERAKTKADLKSEEPIRLVSYKIFNSQEAKRYLSWIETIQLFFWLLVIMFIIGERTYHFTYALPAELIKIRNTRHFDWVWFLSEYGMCIFQCQLFMWWLIYGGYKWSVWSTHHIYFRCFNQGREDEYYQNEQSHGFIKLTPLKAAYRYMGYSPLAEYNYKSYEELLVDETMMEWIRLKMPYFNSSPVTITRISDELHPVFRETRSANEMRDVAIAFQQELNFVKKRSTDSSGYGAFIERL